VKKEKKSFFHSFLLPGRVVSDTREGEGEGEGEGDGGGRERVQGRGRGCFHSKALKAGSARALNALVSPGLLCFVVPLFSPHMDVPGSRHRTQGRDLFLFFFLLLLWAVWKSLGGGGETTGAIGQACRAGALFIPLFAAPEHGACRLLALEPFVFVHLSLEFLSLDTHQVAVSVKCDLLYLEPEKKFHLTPSLFARVFARDETERFEVFVRH
jgi:hypothetical protein